MGIARPAGSPASSSTPCGQGDALWEVLLHIQLFQDRGIAEILTEEEIFLQ